MGGFNYLLNLLTGLTRFESATVRPFLFCGNDATDSDVEKFEALDGVTVIRSPIFQHNRLLSTMLLGVDLEAKDIFSQYQIDAVFETATFYGWRFPVPTIAWFPDLQHKQMPKLFPWLGWWRREIGFRMQLMSGRYVILSSESAKNDFQRFYPRYLSQVNVLRFPARITKEEMDINPCELLASYDLPDRYAVLPNQFWKHKNHAVVVEAIAVLRKKGKKVNVVTTGSHTDPRYPELFDDLTQRMRALGVIDNFYMLGMVPRSHLLALLRTCSVLINPSRFEGWSTIVEEGKALGIPMLLSNLPVHREQAGEQAVYFNVDDVDKLADYLDMYANIMPIKPRELQVNGDKQLAEFSSRFRVIAERAKNH